MRIADYQPSYYENVKEFKLLANIEDELFEILEKELTQTHANNFVMTANEKAIRIYEDALKIKADPSTETLEFRRWRILNRFQMRSPYTLRFLKERLDAILGAENYSLTMEYDEYTLYLEIVYKDSDRIKETNTMIRQMKPANIRYIMIPVVLEKLLLSESAKQAQVKLFRVGKSKIGDSLMEIINEQEVEVG